jgi:geranylgeranyl diphosphate synthase, type I
VLIALARERLPTNARRLLDELLGDPELSDSQVELLQNTITSSGALDALETLIEDNSRQALTAIADAPLSRSAKLQLTQLADTVIRRTA